MSDRTLIKRQALAQVMDAEQVHKMMRTLWEASARLKLNERSRHNLALTVAMLTKSAAGKSATKIEATVRMSSADVMAALA